MWPPLRLETLPPSNVRSCQPANVLTSQAFAPGRRLLYTCLMQPLPQDNRAVLFYHPLFLEHDSGYGHPESADRLRGILAALRARGISEDDLVRPRPADIGLVSELHDPRYLAVLEKAANSGGGYWDADTHISTASYEAALLGAGAAVEAVDAVMSGARSAFALVRP